VAGNEAGYESILKRKGKLSFVFLLFLIGFNVQFLVPLLLPMARGGEFSDTLRYYLVGFTVMFLAGGLALMGFGRMRTAQRSYSYWGGALLFVLLLAAAHSLIKGHSIYYDFRHFVAYLCLLVLPALGYNRKCWPILNKFIILHTFVGSAYIIFVLSTRNIALRTELYEVGGYNVIASSLYAIQYIIITYPIQTRLGKTSALVGTAAWLLYSLFLNHRITFILFPLDLLLLLVIMKRLNMIKQALFRSLIIGIFILVPLLLGMSQAYRAISQSELAQRLSIGVAKTQEKFTQAGDLSSTFVKNVRWTEIRIAAGQMGITHWLMGKGLAATWQHPQLYDGMPRRVVHFSYMNYLFHGGIPLLILLLVPLIWIIRAFFGGKDPFVICCAAYLLTQYLTMASYSIVQWTLGWALFCLCIGVCLKQADGTPSEEIQREDSLVHQHPYARRMQTFQIEHKRFRLLDDRPAYCPKRTKRN
jgi:hypothetical protein